jgi:hypothetical protein
VDGFSKLLNHLTSRQIERRAISPAESQAWPAMMAGGFIRQVISTAKSRRGRQFRIRQSLSDGRWSPTEVQFF